jgi:hypothetical protein
MRGTINSQSKDSYRIRVSIGKDAVTGKYIQHSETVVGTHPEAEKRLRQLLTDLDKGVFVRPGKATVGEYLVRWLSDYVKPNLSPSTHALYSIICTKHIIPTLGNVALAKLKPTHLQHLYAIKQEAGLTKIHHLIERALISMISFNYKSKENGLGSNI